MARLMDEMLARFSMLSGNFWHEVTTSRLSRQHQPFRVGALSVETGRERTWRRHLFFFCEGRRAGSKGVELVDLENRDVMGTTARPLVWDEKQKRLVSARGKCRHPPNRERMESSKATQPPRVRVRVLSRGKRRQSEMCRSQL